MLICVYFQSYEILFPFGTIRVVLLKLLRKKKKKIKKNKSSFKKKKSKNIKTMKLLKIIFFFLKKKYLISNMHGSRYPRPRRTLLLAF
jgi:hypothetical protein